MSENRHPRCSTWGLYFNATGVATDIYEALRKHDRNGKTREFLSTEDYQYILQEFLENVENKIYRNQK